MSPEFALWLILISSTDGHEIEREQVSMPMELAECAELQVQQGIQSVRDGAVAIYQCRQETLRART